MRNLFLAIILTSLFFSCSQTQQEPDTVVEQASPVKTEDFFPVTNFIRGQITEISTGGVNPLKITTAGTRTDSAWIKVEDLEMAFSDFLHPSIDSSSMARFFNESKFLDQTLNTYTFTYEPSAPLPDSMEVQRWDVYINPKINTVKRIYIEKEGHDGGQKQLTWQSKEWCKVVSFSAAGAIEKEVLIKWKFE
jgi:hypothetical protein